MKKIVIINGPNLDRLGKREPEVYGHETLADLEALMRKQAEPLGVELDFFQSNHEGSLVDKFSEIAEDGTEGVIINPGAYAHTSVALRDAAAGSGLTVIEVHISNVYKREEFRHKSYLSPVCLGVICGLGLEGYIAALHKLAGM